MNAHPLERLEAALTAAHSALHRFSERRSHVSFPEVIEAQQEIERAFGALALVEQREPRS